MSQSPGNNITNTKTSSLSSDQLTLLRYQIRELGELLRIQKQKSPDWHTDQSVLDNIWKLLDLKSKDPQIPLDEVWGHSQPLRRIRLRFRVTDANGTVRRMQNVFRGKTHLTASEVIDAITQHLKTQHQRKPDLFPHWGFTKIEFVTQENNKKVYKSVTTQDDFRVPLVFPGPVLLHDWCLEFRVYLPCKPYHFITPPSYSNARLELIDCGTNLFHKDFEKSLNRTIHRAFSAGVSQSILISTNSDTIQKNLEICSKHPNSLFCVIGIHPKDVTESLNLKEIDQFEEIIKKYRNLVVGIGEIGFDSKSKEKRPNETTQLKWFEAQLRLASKLHLPVLIHERDAHKLTINLLQKYRSQLENIVINCFTGDAQQLRDYVALDCYIVITGIITNTERAPHLKEVIKHIPLQKLLISTDAPYLTPFNMPRPFPRRNEPACISWVLTAVAEALAISPQQLANITTTNARRVFKLPTLAYNGTLASVPQLIFEEVQKQEDDLVKSREEKKKPPTIKLQPGQEIFEYQERKWIVSQKEKSLLEKQSKIQHSEGLLQLIKDLEAKEIPKNSIIIANQTQTQQSDNSKAPKESKRNERRGRGRGRGQFAKK